MNIVSRLKEIKTLPALPEVVAKVHDIFHSPEGDTHTAARIIEQDVAISAVLLRVANSAHYNPGGKRINSISRAIVRMGYAEVESIITAVGFIARFRPVPSPLDYAQFWRHSLTCAYLARCIARRCSCGTDEDAQQSVFLAGLLHDLGILLLDQYFPKKFHDITYAMRTSDASFLTLEHQQLAPQTHPVIGGILLELWNIDTTIINMVRAHHDPAKAPRNYTALAAIVYCAEFMLCNWNVGSFEGDMGDIDEQYLAHIGISHDSLLSIFEKVQNEVEVSEIIRYAMHPPNESMLLRKI